MHPTNPYGNFPNQSYSYSQQYPQPHAQPTSPNQGILAWLDAYGAQEHVLDPNIYSDPRIPPHYPHHVQPQPHQQQQPSHLQNAQYAQYAPQNMTHPYASTFQQSSSSSMQRTPSSSSQYQYSAYASGDGHDDYESSSSSRSPSDSGSPRVSRARSTITLDPSQPLTVDGKPRERVYVACDRCRVRKLRCDGAKPSCFNCQRVAETGVQCHYDPVPKRRGQDRAPRTRSAIGVRQPRKPAVRKGSLEAQASQNS